MIEETAENYAKYLCIDIPKELSTMRESMDDMLTRLEEFESMVAVVQEERGNVVGITGTLSEVVDMEKDLRDLCFRVDALEQLVDKIKLNVDSLEDQIQIAEDQYKIGDGSSHLKNLLLQNIFKKPAETRPTLSSRVVEELKVEDFFVGEQPSSS